MVKESNHHKVLILGFCLVGLALLVKLFWIQLVDVEYKIKAENNAFKRETIYPTRGLIYDRKGLTLVDNQIVHDIMVSPARLKAFDTTAFCALFDLRPAQLDSLLAPILAKRRRIGFQAVPLLRKVDPKPFALFMEQNYKFEGFSGQARNVRNYPLASAGSLLGYLMEADERFLEKNPQYKPGDYIGKSGIEETYEPYLKGEKGYSIYLRDVHNRIQASYKDGAYDKGAVKGKDLVTTLDASLQAFGEELMRGKVGSLVAIEPSTGEILTLVTSPGLETEQLPNMGKYYKELLTNPLNPMFNRAVMSPYPPGSCFKLVTGLIGLQLGVVEPQTLYPCHSGYKVGRGVGCHAHKSPINLIESIMMSCNAYYCYVFRNILDRKGQSIDQNLTEWREYVESFGFGHKLGSDLPSERGGSLPSAALYNKYYGSGRWNSLSVISLSIGQGEVGATPLQLANLAAIMANRGHYYTPHLVKEVRDTLFVNPYTEPHYTKVDRKWFDVGVEGMYLAVNAPAGAGGTAHIAAVPGLEICGKTGTAQNPHGSDNSVFMCFAPRENPRIAVAAYIEKGGFGATWAAPIASLLVEQYLTDSISTPRQDLLKRMREGDLLYKFKK